MQCAITGAASGIGQALARRFALDGAAVIGIDRDQANADRTRREIQSQGGHIQFLDCDLSDSRQIEVLLERLEALPAIRVFVHCAGTSAVGRFGSLCTERQRRVIEVNLTAPLLLTAGLLEKERIERGGTLVFISSLSHYTSYPGASAYAASKDALSSYARSLSVALGPRDIGVLTVFPGPTRTPHARRFSPDNSREHLRMPPEKVAEAIFVGVAKGKRIVIPGVQNRVIAMASRLFPSLIERAFEKAVFEKLP